MKNHSLFVIGVGPGDPELLTLKAVRLLKEAGCVIVPKGKDEGSSLALSIAQGAVDLSGKEIVELHFPMVKTASDHGLEAKWDTITNSMVEALMKHRNAVFITLGDPSIYSTFFYVYEKIKQAMPKAEISLIPGISSINAAACCASMALTLGSEKMAIVPATYEDERLEGIIQDFETVILMKVYRVFDRIVGLLERLGLTERAVYVSHAGMADERVYWDLRSVAVSERDYFSLIIVKNSRASLPL